MNELWRFIHAYVPDAEERMQAGATLADLWELAKARDKLSADDLKSDCE